LPASNRQPGHEGAENNGNRLRRIAENETRQADPDQFINQAGRTGKKEDPV